MTVQTTNRADILNRARKGGRAVKNTAAHLPDMSSAVAGVRELADQLPDLDDVADVAEGDRSPLSETEVRQRDLTEGVIRSALAAGDAAIWVIGKALTLAAKGKFHRDQNLTFDQYARSVTGKSPAHVRRWMDGAPLALAVAAATGTNTPSEHHVRNLRKVEKDLGRRPAIELYQSADKAAGEGGQKVTGAVIIEIRKQLPAELPEDPEEAAQVVRDTTRRVMTAPPKISSPIGEEIEKEPKGPASGDDGPAAKAAPVRIAAVVPAEVAAKLGEWADFLSLGHRVPLDTSDVLALVVELATDQGASSLSVLSDRIEDRHTETAGRGVARFTWRPNPRAKATRTAERRIKGHPAAKGSDWTPHCATPAPAEGEPCAELTTWKVEDPQQGTAYYCDKHLPEEDTPPGVWRD
ncbi:hypothetical protein [Streptomyces sp. H27-H5]|uniref:hypothetical protein n=1 Tax=Streptomyces sp. H27-H5 TaxID=2996460 RepID=UPI002270DB25|nr:hypothetical protein [Streptomyces sp. H27-H5]MCY0961458.1 hypothetical protein [Streptomyces sp. H27-H5]